MGLWMTASLRHKVATAADLLASVAGMLQLQHVRTCVSVCEREKEGKKCSIRAGCAF